jgi:hypothetical protein
MKWHANFNGLPIIKKAAVQATTNDQVVLQPTMGGSLPLYLFENY